MKKATVALFDGVKPDIWCLLHDIIPCFAMIFPRCNRIIEETTLSIYLIFFLYFSFVACNVPKNTIRPSYDNY
jgi:hypothetical protein